jgi:hypothetical protein
MEEEENNNAVKDLQEGRRRRKHVERQLKVLTCLLLQMVKQMYLEATTLAWCFYGSLHGGK